MQQHALTALLGQVRRRLRIQRLMRGLRTALRATAIVCVAAVPVHLWLHSLPVTAIVVALLIAWLVILAASARHPPTLADCADWADRHLDGASAYATAIEAARVPKPEESLEALAWLENGMRGRVEHSRRLLGSLETGSRLGRPALVATVCLALALAVLQLPGRVGAGPSGAAGTPAAGENGEGARLGPERGEAALAKAMREAQQDEARDGPLRMAGREEDRAGARRVPGDPDPTAGLPATPQDDGPGAERSSAADRERPDGQAHAGEGAGREAGGSPDRRSPAGSQDELAAGIEAIRRELSLDGGPEGRRADASAQASFTSGTTPAATGPAIAPAPARPPRATDRIGRGPADAAYVAAYFEARGSR